MSENFYSTTAYTDKLISYLRSRPEGSPFGYLAYTAPHDPLQVPDEWLDRYKGKYDGGYPALKRARTKRMKAMGLISQDMKINPGSEHFVSWESHSPEEKRLQSRKMELLASMVEMVDEEIGKVINHLKEAGEYENTIIFFMSDNGANPKDPHFYSNLTPEEINTIFDNSWENLGRRRFVYFHWRSMGRGVQYSAFLFQAHNC